MHSIKRQKLSQTNTKGTQGGAVYQSAVVVHVLRASGVVV